MVPETERPPSGGAPTTTNTAASNAVRRPVPVLKEREGEDFQRAVNRFVARRFQDSLTHLVAPENKLHLNHGKSWGCDRDGGPGSQGVLKQTSTETTVTFESVMRNDVSALSAFIATVSEAISSAVQKEMYATVSAAADSIGNVVSQKEAGSPAKAFLEMLKKIEFGVNSRGDVTLPSIHVTPELGKKMLDDLNAQGQEFREEVERVKQEKALAALQRERERLGKYRKP